MGRWPCILRDPITSVPVPTEASTDRTAVAPPPRVPGPSHTEYDPLARILKYELRLSDHSVTRKKWTNSRQNLEKGRNIG